MGFSHFSKPLSIEYIDSEEGFNCLDHKSLAQLTKKYLARFDEVKAHVSETLPEMNKDLKRHKHTAVNKYAAKTSLFETANAIESNMFKGDGLKVPDLTCKSGLDALIAWDGHENTLPQVKVVLCKASWDKEVSSEM